MIHVGLSRNIMTPVHRDRSRLTDRGIPAGGTREKVKNIFY